MNCCCGKKDGYYVALVTETHVYLESKCCITTLICAIETVEFSV